MKTAQIRGQSKKQKRIIILIVLIAAAIAALAVLNILTGGTLLSAKNLKNVWAGSCVPTLVAFGFLIVFTGNVTDLSPGGIVILAATATGLVGNALGIPMMIAAGTAVGVACMLANFLVYRLTKIPPWIAGLGLLMVYESIAVNYATNVAAKGQKVVVMDNAIRGLGQQPGIYVCWIIGIVAAFIIFNHTSLGINYRAAGDNEEVAKIMGINVDKAMILGGIVAGAFFGFGGVVKESYASFVNAQSGLTSLSTTFQPMAAALLAMALGNYINVVIAIPISTFLITLVFNVLTLFGVPSGTFQDFVLGIIVICFAALANRKMKGVVK